VYRSGHSRQQARDRFHDRSDDCCYSATEPADEVDQEATSVPERNDDTAPGCPNGPTARLDGGAVRHLPKWIAITAPG